MKFNFTVVLTINGGGALIWGIYKLFEKAYIPITQFTNLCWVDIFNINLINPFNTE